MEEDLKHHRKTQLGKEQVFFEGHCAPFVQHDNFHLKQKNINQFRELEEVTLIVMYF